MMPPTEQWRPPVPSDEAVVGTHVDAALAKVSCAKLGYFEDRWTEHLMRNSRPPPRSPLIHRGYFSRVAAIRGSVKRFLSSCPPGQGVQIVDLGAGLDSTYFWIRDSPALWREDLTFFEVDFPEVASKKLSAVQKKPILWPLLDATSKEDLVGERRNDMGLQELRTKHLRYVGADMRMVQELDSAMKAAGLQPDVPTLFLSECVLVYMQALQGDSIIEWTAKAVPDAPCEFVAYEQCNPTDPFGKVMVENLMRRGCPLLSIHEYPTIESQRQRYMARGWDRCAAADMHQVHDKYLDVTEVERIQRLELLDEYEEWYLIQQHYFLLSATRAKAADSWVHSAPIVPAPTSACGVAPPGGAAAGGVDAATPA